MGAATTGAIGFLVLNELLLHAVLIIPPLVFQWRSLAKGGTGSDWDDGGHSGEWEPDDRNVTFLGGPWTKAWRAYEAVLISLALAPVFYFLPVSLPAVVLRLLVWFLCMFMLHTALAFYVRWWRQEHPMSDSAPQTPEGVACPALANRLIYSALPVNAYGIILSTQVAKLAGTVVLTLKAYPGARFLDPHPTSAAAWILTLCTAVVIALDIECTRARCTSHWARDHVGYYFPSALYTLFYLCGESPAPEARFVFGLNLALACSFAALKALRPLWRCRLVRQTPRSDSVRREQAGGDEGSGITEGNEEDLF